MDSDVQFGGREIKVSGPVRTCILCGKKGSKTSLVRFAVDRGVIVLDEKFRMPGRGVYSCRQEKCLRMLAKKEKKLVRALRAEGRVAKVSSLPFEISVAGWQVKQQAPE